MSDQPKPATGEWTVSPIGEILHNGEVMATAFTYVQGKACVDAINAALAAERGKMADAEILCRELQRNRDEIHKQLAAEREKAQKKYQNVSKKA
jgi:hypothetical protein